MSASSFISALKSLAIRAASRSPATATDSVPRGPGRRLAGCSAQRRAATLAWQLQLIGHQLLELGRHEPHLGGELQQTARADTRANPPASSGVKDTTASTP